ncbi:MAG: Error-prone DNA polymerase [Methanomassiliicoccales archaeon PtaU1.Bin124]|nr:MAG: Error-prone DNA polymerase [Methanomassiliicoccales archaeon PtaU1.Bin124]
MKGKADVHVHTKYSGVGEYGILRFPESISDPEDVVTIARQKGVNVLCITDHNSIEGAIIAKKFAERFDDIEVVVGEEVSTIQGEVIGLFLTEQIPLGMGMAETIAEIRRQGGLVVAPHPFSYHVPAMGSLIDEMDVDGIEVINGGHVDGPSNDRAWEHSRSGRWARTAGSDAHSLSQVAWAYTLFEGKTSADFRKAILERTTEPMGEPYPVRLGVTWGIGIVLESDKLMMKSLFGMLEGKENDPIALKVSRMRTDQKIISLFGSLIFFTPPMPFLVAMIGTMIMRKKEERAHKLEAMRMRRMRKKPANPQ